MARSLQSVPFPLEFSNRSYSLLFVQGGDFRIIGNRVTKKIMSNKLQLVWDRRPCGDLKKIECQGKDQTLLNVLLQFQNNVS